MGPVTCQQSNNLRTSMFGLAFHLTEWISFQLRNTTMNKRVASKCPPRATSPKIQERFSDDLCFFWHDRVPCHRAKVMRTTQLKNHGTEIWDLGPGSPNLNA